MASDLVKPHHLDRRAVIYVRQSTQHQVLTNQESTRLQYALRQRARDLGWREADVEVVDADLGLSGATAADRQGFKDLVARVTLGEVGLILSTEVTRLARNCSDWYPLLDVCGHRRCLIGDRDGVYDPALPDGRLLLGLKGTISEVELHTIRGRLTAGLINKVQRGDLALQLPAGLVRDPSGVVTKDPNLEVQERVALVFDSFLRLRSAVRVTRALHERGLGLPRSKGHGEVHWRAPRIAAVTRILKNPAYAGAFVYGRTCMREATTGGRRKQARRPDEGWRFVVRDRYPAYVGWDTFEKIQAMLRDNRAEYVHLQTRGVPRDGAALLHGITWCGECGHKMRVRYKGGSQYVCNHLQVQHGHVTQKCQVLRSAAIDAQVASAFLEAVTPAEMDAWSEARRVEGQADTALRRAEEQQVERLRYQAGLAERQFNRVDPDNRLVAAELERRWEAALIELRRAEAALAQHTSPALAGASATLDPQLRSGAGGQPGFAQAVGRPRRQPGAPQGAAALPDRQGGAAPHGAGRGLRADRLARRRGQRGAGRPAREHAGSPAARRRDGSAGAGTGPVWGQGPGDCSNADRRRAPLHPARPQNTAQHGAGNPLASRDQDGLALHALASCAGLADGGAGRGTAARP